MLSFVYGFGQRVLSGAQSMYGYGKKRGMFLLFTILMLLFPLLTFQPTIIFYIFFVVNAFDVYMKAASFNLLPYLTFLKKYRDIHFWENLVTGGYVVFLILAGFNILLIMCSVYPALIIHKGLINIGSGLSFFATATDDETGKTYGIPLLGIKIKRSSNTYRLILAGVSLVAALVIFLMHWNISLSL